MPQAMQHGGTTRSVAAPALNAPGTPEPSGRIERDLPNIGSAMRSGHSFQVLAVWAAALALSTSVFGTAAAADANATDQRADRSVAPAETLVPTGKRATLQAKRDRKLEKMAAKANQGEYSLPQEAMTFFVNKRTGPIETRGPNVTTETRALDPGAYLSALQDARRTPVYSTAMGSMLSASSIAAAGAGSLLGTWSSLGPSNQGGRTRQLLIDPNNPSIMYTAAVGGGVWKSTDAGGSWNQLTDLKLPNIAVASLAMDPKNSSILYAGTGEGVFNGDAIRGTGIFVSTDAGATWSALAATVPAAGLSGDFSYVFNIVVSSRSSQRLYASTRTGLHRSNDGGATWTKLIDATSVRGCHDIVMQTKRSVGYVFVSCGTFTASGAAIGVHRALDGASTAFAQVFTMANMGRTSLAIAPSNENYVYAMVAHQSTHGMLAIVRSTTNGGLGSWTTQVNSASPTKLNTVQVTNPVIAFLTECGFGTSSFSRQGWYDNVIAVDPTDPERLWSGGIDLMRSDDGGKNWGVASYWWFDQGIDPQYAHADNHVIRFHPAYDGVSNKKMFVASDGGIFRTDDARAPVGTTVSSVCGNPVPGQVSWTELNNNYTTTQFYYGSVYPDGNTYFGGFQDNGTWRGTTASTQWTKLLGGDGGYTAVDTQGDANAANDVLFGENTGKSIQRSVNGGASFSNVTGTITGSGFAFIAPFTMNTANRQQLWTGGFDIWRTVNQAANWQRVGGVNATPGSGSLSAIATSPSNPNKVIAAFSDGFISFTSTALTTGNTGNGWITNSTQPAAFFVSDVAFDPTNENIAYATFETFTGNSVFKSTDSGATWAAVPGSGANVLPKVPAHAVVVDPTNPSRVYVGTDIGVYTSLDGGANWFRENTGFGNVSVEHLEINSTGTKRLFAFTHGRGAWRVDLNP